MVWQKGQNVLSAKSIMVTPDPRIKLVNHHSLQIRSIKSSDAGDYQCKISVLGDPIVIVHTLEILGKYLYSKKLFLKNYRYLSKVMQVLYITLREYLNPFSYLV